MPIDLFGVDTPAKGVMSAHESSVGGTDEWLTPRHIVEALGPFDLDPCSPIKRPWPTASKHYTIEDDGLRQAWEGRVWLNPPYANVPTWMARLRGHGTGTALLFARTETATWHELIWPHATAILFLRGRLRFHSADGRRATGNAGAPSALIAYGKSDANALAASGIPGALVTLGGDE